MTDDASRYRPRPTKLGHLVLKVRDIQRSLAFYTDIVGLEVSDWIGDHMVFLRCGVDHHDLALLQLPPGHGAAPEGFYPSVEHFSYRVESLDEMEKITAMLVARGVAIDRGLGRHGPGANTFIVFKDPDGNNVEFYSDMTQIRPDAPYEPSVWDGEQLETFDRWHLEKFVVPPPARILPLLKRDGGEA
ncbi:VOC family protein [Sphingomonas sp. AR_OL41]|uniref:VOC family protein n=1 Tax=Sphingomonas sp. AR_OL41 TaxID=3042729 RepID=UPI00247FB876|nr:VOC family protein [Sphingomonas sp. AR_OL41]MDH7972095.1 VOC family protein [Sphingomonas sp. AR_OL41]